MKSPFAAKRAPVKEFHAMPIAERREKFIAWLGGERTWAEQYIKSWKTGGLLPNETIEDVTHNILDAIKADVKSWRAGLERFKRLNDHAELAPAHLACNKNSSQFVTKPEAEHLDIIP